MISRRSTREYLLQSLYAEMYNSPFDRNIFDTVYFSDENTRTFDTAYVETMTITIHEHEPHLLAIIHKLAPRFELDTLPVVHILILMISLTEMLYTPKLAIPQTVSINEAVELAKRFSDEQGKNFINGALATFIKEKDTIMNELSDVSYRIFAPNLPSE